MSKKLANEEFLIVASLIFELFIKRIRHKSVFILIDMVRRIKYKEYDNASNMLGISYRDFKKFIKKH